MQFGGDEEEKKEKDSKYADSKIPKEIKDLMDFVFDFDMIKASAVKIGFDVQRMPLGQLSADQVNRGIAILKQIEQVIDSKKGKPADYSKLSSEFYT